MQDLMGIWPGFCAGITQAIIGHPLDTIKTLMQNHQPWYNIGIKGYYRGIVPPFISGIMVNSILFPSYEWLNTKNDNCYWLSGGIAGSIVTPIVFYLDIFKYVCSTYMYT